MITLRRLSITACLVILLSACASGGAGGSGYSGSNIGSLSGKKIVVKEEHIEGGLEKAIAGYKKFLKEVPEAEQIPEALRRIADLKIQSVEGVYDNDVKLPTGSKPGKTKVFSPIISKKSKHKRGPSSKSLKSIERRSAKVELDSGKRNQIAKLPPGNTMQQQVLKDNANSKEAIAIYKKLLKKYPNHEHNDRVLYQLARAYGIRGQQTLAIRSLDRIVRKYPYTALINEVQFRRGEILFVRKRYRDSETAYKAVVGVGRRSDFYDQSLYKHGWSLFKQSRYEEALESFIKLIDHMAAGGRDTIVGLNKIERQRFNDTLRVISFSFSYLGGSRAIDRYFKTHGRKPYEDMLFSDLGEHYLVKRRYADSAKSYARFVERNPLHNLAPFFQMRVIDVYKKGGFPKLVIESKREFAVIYDINGNYWKSHKIKESQKVLAFIKKNLVDLAKHYHALSQKRGRQKEYKEAITWYGKYLASFPKDKQAPKMNFLLAEVLFDNRQYRLAAVEYEKTAYQYPAHKKSAEAAYASVLAYREQKKVANKDEKHDISRLSIISSIRFADTFPNDSKAAGVLNQAAVDTFRLNDFKAAQKLAQRVLTEYKKASQKIKRSAWTVIAHTSFDLGEYTQSEKAYQEAIKRLSKKSTDRAALGERLAASVYKQGELLQKSGNLNGAVKHFLRIADLAPRSTIRMLAQYDAGAALIQLKDWDRATKVLEDYRKRNPANSHQDDVIQKLAVAYEESRQWQLAAVEYDRISKDNKDPELRRAATMRAAQLFERANKITAAMSAYRRFIERYPKYIEQSMEARHHLAKLYKETNKSRKHESVLRAIVRVDRDNRDRRTDRTRYIAAMATLELSEPVVRKYKKIRLTLPLKRSLARKKKSMENVLKIFSDMLDYQVVDVTAAATFSIADTYYDLTRAILESDRPRKLSKLELEQYDILLEEQAYPFEEKAIKLHQKNLELLRRGIYNDWVDKSINQLGKLVPIRYSKAEKGEVVVMSKR